MFEHRQMGVPAVREAPSREVQQVFHGKASIPIFMQDLEYFGKAKSKIPDHCTNTCCVQLT